MPMSASVLARFALSALFSLAAFGASAAAQDEAPEWSDEPPALARLLESGYKAESLRQPGVAAAHYCAAARDGSVEGQYRLGRLYLMGQGVARDNQIATTLLSIAAQRGHEKARSLVVPMAGAERLPDCLVTGASPAVMLAEAASEEAVPQEVVDRFVKALPADKRRLAQMVQKLAPRFKVDPRLALAIVRTESNFDAAARSPKNALGLMQLIPDTAERFGVRDALDPEQNIRGGLAYLRVLLSQFKGDVALAAAAYNAGEGNVMRYKGVPPFAETQEYVRRILAFYRAPRHAETLRG